jgi:glyoxylase-like metal-dependent hydrolase (beta-lactamase superfamily II)
MKKPLFSILALLLALVSFAQDMQDTQIETIQVSDHVYMLTGRGGNIGIYKGAEYTLMIDDQFAPLSSKIKAAISKITDTPIRFLVNTHMHGDHTGGNANFNTTETTLVAHANVRKSLKAQGKEAEKFPELTFSDDITLYEGDETIMIFHVHKAHTDGDAMIYFVTDNVLHMGDTYFSQGYPYIDLKSGGSVDGYIGAHEKALMLINADTKIIPGHGQLSSKADLQQYTAMLKDLRTRVQASIDQGQPLEQVQTDTQIDEKYNARFGQGWITGEKIRATFYTSLKDD